MHRLKTIRKKGKPVGAVAVVRAKDAAKRLMLLYYPKPEHIKRFEQAVHSTVPGGPSRNFPGAVGSLKLEFLKPDLITIEDIQAHFKVPENEYLTSLSSFLPRTLEREYVGWRGRLIQTVFDIAKETKATIQFDDYNAVRADDADEKRSIRNRDEMVTKLAIKNGYKIYQDITSKGAHYKVLVAEPI